MKTKYVILLLFVIYIRVPTSVAFAGELKLYPTYDCIGIRYQGRLEKLPDVEFRESGTGEWLKAHPLCQIEEDKWVGSLFFLKDGTQYEIRMMLNGNVIAEGEVSTRSDVVPDPAGREIFVSAKATSNGNGSNERPFRSISEAISNANPGDVVQILPGEYFESVFVEVKGTREMPLFIRGMEGTKLLGYDPKFINSKGEGLWQYLGGDIYAVPIDYMPRYLAVEGLRLYQYSSFEDFRDRNHSKGDTANPWVTEIGGGWFYDESAGNLYIRLPNSADPNVTPIQVNKERFGFIFAEIGEANVVIENLEFGYFDIGIRILETSRVRVKGCKIRNCRTGVYIEGMNANENTIEQNEVSDTNVWRWPWDAVKGTLHESGGIEIRGGYGNVVRRNVIHGMFNGIYSSTWGDLENDSYNNDYDCYENQIYNISDDSIEPEGTCVNNRFWHNFTFRTLVGISLAPITRGPTWVIQNVFCSFWSTAVKFGINSSGRIYIYHNTVYTNLSETNGVTSWDVWDNIMWRNNIFRGTRYVFEDTHLQHKRRTSFDYNCWFTTDPGRLIKWVGKRYYSLRDFSEVTGQETHGISVDPLFVAPEQANFRLSPQSPCIDAGLVIPGINDSFGGKAPDMGYYEYGKGIWSPIGPVREFPPWDVNKDGQVDIFDFLLVAQHFGEEITTPSLDTNPDVNDDGEIDILDLVLVCAHFQAKGEVRNLVQNADFDSLSVAPWTIWAGAAPWTIWVEDANAVATMMIDNKESLTGDRSLLINISEEGSGKRVEVHQGHFDLKKGQKLIYALWAKAEQSEIRSAEMVVSHREPPWTRYGSRPITITDEWTEFWTPVNITGDDDLVGISVIMDDTPGRVWFDHFRLYEGDYIEEDLEKVPERAVGPVFVPPNGEFEEALSE